MTTIVSSWIIRAFWTEMMCHIIMENGHGTLGLIIAFIPVVEGFYWLKKM